MNHGRTALGLAVCGVLATADVAAAGPLPGARYVGANAAGDRTVIVVHRSGTRLARYNFSSRIGCSDGKQRFLGWWEGGERPLRVDPAGAFTLRSEGRASFRTRRGPVLGVARTSIRGSFDASGDVVTGTVQSSFTSRRLRCTGEPVRFTAYRAGTPNAPLRDATMATGVYRGAGRGVALRLRMIAPGRELAHGTLRWRTRCRNGGRVAISETHRRIWLRGDVLTIRWRRRGREDGLRSRVTTVLRVRFRNDGVYAMSGTLRARARYFRDGRLVDTCTVRTRVRGELEG